MVRYQTLSFTSSSISGGASGTSDRTSLPNYLNIVRLKVTADSAGGSFDFLVYKKDTYLAADLLAFWDNVTAVYDPMDNSSGTPAEAEEGPAIPYEDEDGTNELHLKFINNDSVSHTYTVTLLYEEAPLMSSSGGMTLRAGLVATTVSGTVVSASTAFRAASGSASTPGIAFTADSTTGAWFSSGAILFAVSGATTFVGNTNTLYVGSGMRIGFSSNADPGNANADTYFTRAAANSVQLNGIFSPDTDNTYTNGTASKRWSAVHTGGFVAIGTTPATTGALRIANGGSFYWRDGSNASDIQVLTVDGGNTVGIVGINGGNTILNYAGADVNTVMSADNNTNAFFLDAGLYAGKGALGILTAAADGASVYLDPPAISVTANGSYGKLVASNSGAVTVPAGTAAVVASLWLNEPNITATGTVTVAATLYISGAPTEGTGSYAEYIAAGNVRWGAYGAGTATFDASGNITSVSDERAKIITGKFGAGLAELRKIDPIVYKWREGLNLETKNEYAGFGSNNVFASIPLATGMNPDGMRTLQDRALLAAVVNAIKELDSRLEGRT